MSSLAPSPLRETAKAERARAGRAVDALPDPGLPEWLATMHKLRPTGEVHLLRDVFGDRFGVIASFAFPGVPASWFLFDIHASGTRSLAAAGDFDTLEQAAEAWRGWAGETASPDAPRPVTAMADLVCLRAWGTDDLVADTVSRVQLDNLFRARRRRDDLIEYLAERGTPVPPALSRLVEDPEQAEEDFQAWYRARTGTEPDPDAVTDLAMEWFAGALAGAEHVVSERRAAFLVSVMEDWRPTDTTRAARALVPDWIRWNGERAGQPGDLVDRAVAAAS